VYNMVVDNYHQRYRPTKQFFFRYLLKRRIEREWHFMKTVPYEVLDHAISGAITARDEVITRNRERFANGNQAPIHRLAFLTKKSARNTITIRSQYCRTPLKFYVRLLHNREMLACQPDRKKGDTHPPFHHENRRKNHHWPNLEGSVDCDSKLTYDKRLRQWTLAWVYQKDAGEGENQANPRVVSLDPGVVSFQTWYSPTGGTGSIGTRDIERIVRLCLQMDNLIGRTTKVDARKRNGYRRAQARIRQRIRNLVDEMHKQVANWLANNFDIIVLPQFGSQRMSLRRPGRRLNSKTVRNMLTWSHARFRTRLGGKCEETGAQLVTPDSEAYTSKTCTGCGNLHLRLGGARVFRCRQCGLIMDRDANAAKGILLRALACGALSA
jgi:transposase